MARKEADPPTEGISVGRVPRVRWWHQATVAIMNFWEAERRVLTLKEKLRDERAKAQAIRDHDGFDEAVKKRVTPARDKFWKAQEASTIAGQGS